MTEFPAVALDYGGLLLCFSNRTCSSPSVRREKECENGGFSSTMHKGNYFLMLIHHQYWSSLRIAINTMKSILLNQDKVQIGDS